MITFFHVDTDGEQYIASVSERQRRLIIGAINYHSLMQPGRTLRYQIYMGEKWQYPRLADFSVFNGFCTKNAGLQPCATFTAQSTVATNSPYPTEFWNEGERIPDDGTRYLMLTPDDATDDDVMSHWASDTPKQRLYKELELHAPSSFDILREAIRKRRESASHKPTVAYHPWNKAFFENVATSGERSHGMPNNLELAPNNLECVPPSRRSGNAGEVTGEALPNVALPNETLPKAIIIGLHWLQAGGAERWAVETIRLAKKAGLLPIIITDRDGHQPWITKDFCDDALVLPLTPPVQECWADVPLLRSLFEQFDIRGIAIHHCQWLYDHIWWVKRYFPQTHIIDSLHIVEYINRGGYPHEAVTHDQWIDLHHVISPQLVHWLHDIHSIAADKIIDAPLIGLTTSKQQQSVAARRNSGIFTVAFVGRMARQKRPEAFVLAARALNKRYPGRFHFILHGDGELDTFVTELISRYGLRDIIERRSMNIPAQQTYNDADLLLISSVNEGITLTTLEALASGVPVLSTDVGSQRTIIPKQALLPRMTSSFVRATVKAVATLSENETSRAQLWKEETKQLNDFAKLESADALFTRLFEEWSK